MKIADLHAQIAAVCPIVGVSVGRREDKRTWVVHFQPEATEEQKAAALQLIEVAPELEASVL